MTLWQWQELARLGKTEAKNEPDILGVSIDSRQVEPGDLFIALSGDPGPLFHSDVENPRDGHDFIPAAVKAGASAVLYAHGPLPDGTASLKVENTLDGLWALGSAARKRCKGEVIAITGSAGKTTARSWIEGCLSEQYKVHGSIGSLNNHWGVPLSLSRMPRETEVGVFEIGTNHPGEISPLSKMVAPTISVLLNVLPAHIGNFPSFAALEKEKRAIADGLGENGMLILPLELATGASNQISFGLTNTADVSGQYQLTDVGWQVAADVCGTQIEFVLRSGGEHRVLTALAVLAVCYQVGADLSRVAANFGLLDAPPGRGAEILVNTTTVIDDSYNANPVSMQYALDALTERPGRTIAVLGEMRELGEQSAEYHREIASHFDRFDEVVTVGEGFAATPGNRHFESAENIDLGGFAASVGDHATILVKGSNKVFWANGFVSKLVAALEGKP